MAAEPGALPEGRYGRSADERADRKLKIVGGVLGAALLAFVGWAAVHYITTSDAETQMIRSKTIDDSTVQAVLEIRKEKGATTICTLRSLGSDGGEVGRRDFTFDRDETHFTELVTLRTTAHAAATELKGCRTSSQG
ncbi:DUF4307 domain-containing protein [Streptomyces sp. NPDC053048]|uniref:DUF4307 domain-containing protein n=1 Tax=Streptomyces sp. NPDC053048 TaxID=3365694 RepID=UPI0037CD3286